MFHHSNSGSNVLKSKLCLTLIFSFLNFYHRVRAILRHLCKATYAVCENNEQQMRSFCILYSANFLLFDLACERNTVYMSKIRQERHYYKELILRNWRYPNNDLPVYLEPQILNHIGFETLKFQWDFFGNSKETSTFYRFDNRKNKIEVAKEEESLDEKGYSVGLLKYIKQMKKKKALDLDERDQELLQIFKIVENISFEYSSDDDFQVKLYILQLIVMHEKSLRNLKKIEFDYVKSAEEMQAICSINRELIDLKFPCVISIKVMSTIIKTDSLEHVLRKAHRICKFFWTISDRDVFRRDLNTLEMCIYRFTHLDTLVIQLDVEAINIELSLFKKAFHGEQKPPIRSIEIMNGRGSLLELDDFHEFSDTLVHLSIHHFEMDLFKQYIKDVDSFMFTPKDI